MLRARLLLTRVADRLGSGIRGVRSACARQGVGGKAGVSAIEYALLGGLIAVGIIAGLGVVGLELEAMYLRICNAVVGALGGGSC
jgi:Flp pilus assembly pilin Flp